MAVKRVPKAKICRKAITEMTEEIVTMQRLRHPNIVTFLGCCFEPFVCIVMEHCEVCAAAIC